MLEDHDLTDRQEHAHLLPVVLGIFGCYVAIMGMSYWIGDMF